MDKDEKTEQEKLSEEIDEAIEGAKLCYPLEGWTDLHTAAKRGCMEEAKTLLDGGIDVNSRFGDLTTPLLEAAHANRTEMVGLLIDREAEVNTMDVSGMTPLKFAIFHQNEAMVEKLIKSGAATEEALEWAVAKGYGEMTKFIEELVETD